MPIYQNSEQLYACTRELFGRVRTQTPEAAHKLEEFGLSVRFNCQGPAAVIVIDGGTRPANYSFGLNGVRPDLDIDLSADTLHSILMGDLSLTKALASRALVARGPVMKIVVLADLFRQCQTLYPSIASEHGLGQ
jgi:hypothetical protein